MDDSSTASWSPGYPAGKDERVTLLDLDLQTTISDRRPGVTVIDYPLDNPACFWIDSRHVYLRVNWGLWCTVSLSNPNHIAALRAARYCRITHSQDNEISEVTAPVFHIAELPGGLFVQEDKKEPDDGDPPSEEPPTGQQRAIAFLQASIPSELDVQAFTNVIADGKPIDFVVSDDNAAVIFAVFPRDEDFVAISGDDDDDASDPSVEISDTLLDVLDRQRRWIADQDDEAEVKIAIVASSKTLESMADVWCDLLYEKEVELVEYDEYADFIGGLFHKIGDDGDD